MKIAVFDTESDGLLNEATTLWCAVVQTLQGERRHFDPSNVRELPAYLEQFDVLVGHNIIAHDLPILRKLFQWEFKGTVCDTLLLSRTQRPTRGAPAALSRGAGPHSLEAWGLRLGYPKQAHEDWSCFSPEMARRCDQDVTINVELFHYLLEEGKGERWGPCHRLNNRLLRHLQRMEEFGFPFDTEHANRCVRMLDHWSNRIRSALSPSLPLVVDNLGPIKAPFKKDGSYAAANIKFWAGNPNGLACVGGPYSRVAIRSIDLDKRLELIDYLLDLGWKPDSWNTDSQGNKTSPKLTKSDPFRGLEDNRGRLITRYMQCKQRRGTINGWLEAVREDGRITPYVGGFATTARLRHKLLVNVPGADAFFGKWMRRCFVAKDGWVLVGCDSKGNQMRQLAARMGDEEFTRAVLYGTSADGTDLHSLNQRRAKCPTRTIAKNFFYGGILFGAGYPKIAQIISGTVAQAKQLKETYFSEMPKLKAVIDQLTEQWRETAERKYNPQYGRMELRNGYIRGLDGRPILVESEHMVLCYQLQSDEAIQMAAAVCWFVDQMEERGYKWYDDFGLVLWYHDEFQVTCRPELAQEVKELMEESISWAGNYFHIACPHEGDGSIGQNWSETH